jgi:carboxymethylenebutenolidase
VSAPAPVSQRIDLVDVQGSPMEVFVFAPSAAGPHPAIVLCQHIPVGHAGLEHDEFTLRTAQRYAENGYVVAVPFVFHWWPRSADIRVKGEAFRDDWTALDLDAAYALLARDPAVDAERIAIVGHCWGGRVAWLGACTNPRYKACAIFYGGRIRLPMGPPGTPAAIDLAQNLRCPVIGFFGAQDRNPPPEDVDEYEAALRKAGVEHVFHRYAEAGHAFQSFTTPERYRRRLSRRGARRALELLAAASALIAVFRLALLVLGVAALAGPRKSRGAACARAR